MSQPRKLIPAKRIFFSKNKQKKLAKISTIKVNFIYHFSVVASNAEIEQVLGFFCHTSDHTYMFFLFWVLGRNIRNMWEWYLNYIRRAPGELLLCKSVFTGKLSDVNVSKVI